MIPNLSCTLFLLDDLYIYIYIYIYNIPNVPLEHVGGLQMDFLDTAPIYYYYYYYYLLGGHDFKLQLYNVLYLLRVVEIKKIERVCVRVCERERERESGGGGGVYRASE